MVYEYVQDATALGQESVDPFELGGRHWPLLAATKPRQIEKVSTLRLVARTKQRLAGENNKQSDTYKRYGLILIGTGVVYGLRGIFCYVRANQESDF